MRRQLVYDLPTRFFHWLFAGLFLIAFTIGKTVDDESSIFSYHMLVGLTLSFLVVLRSLWGIWGTRHARFSNFALNPKDLLEYFKGILSGSKRLWAGHNPASSWAAIVMMIMTLGLGVTGYLMTSGGDKEALEEVHELLANGFILIVIMHVVGIILHTVRHKDMIGLSMLDGKKANVPSAEEIPNSKSGFGIALVVLVITFGVYLNKNYDGQSRTLQLFGTTLSLGEEEHGSEGIHGKQGEDNHHEEDEGFD